MQNRQKRWSKNLHQRKTHATSYSGLNQRVQNLRGSWWRPILKRHSWNQLNSRGQVSVGISKLRKVTSRDSWKHLVHKGHTQCHWNVPNHQLCDYHIITAPSLPFLRMVDSAVGQFLRCLFEGKFLRLARAINNFDIFPALSEPERNTDGSILNILDGWTGKKCQFLHHAVFKEWSEIFNRQPLCAHRLQRDWVQPTAVKWCPRKTRATEALYRFFLPQQQH